MQAVIPRLTIEKIVFKGYGLGFCEGRAIFVANALPGDIVDVTITRRKNDVSFGTIHEIHQSSQYRIKSGCEVFGTCGACDWLNISYPQQLAFKREITQNEFNRLNITVGTVKPSPRQQFYRNKSFMPVGIVSGKPAIGMYARKSHEIVPHRQCLLHPNVFDQVAELFLEYMQKVNATPYNETTHTGAIRFLGLRENSEGNLLVVVVTRSGKLPFTRQLVRMLTESFPQISGVVQNINRKQGNRITGEENKLLYGKPHLLETLGDYTFALDNKVFFQVNAGQTLQMYDYIREQIVPGSRVIDAYSGVATIGIYISGGVEEVTCIENNPDVLELALENIARNNCTNVNYVNDDTAACLEACLREYRADTIIFDPPRKGLDSAVIKAATTEGVKRIIYISCNISTQVRDIGLLREKGFELVSVQPFDMFPNTYHIENVCVLNQS
ncbi:MAG: 23S rRNA (uracil(1939)-C(5))-methyltransferase RlmD [Candidatus Cloacimonetes bacterium]|nr:23S rRNA (uracil(1939)-C(5))-methyltransferase RlmD [Candidatus Cloacimonadota bacterium]